MNDLRFTFRQLLKHKGAFRNCRSVPLLAPIIHGHSPGVLPTGMAIEEHEIGTQPMPGGCDSAFTA